MVNLKALIDDAKCFETVRAMRRPEGGRCPECNASEITEDGRDDTQPDRQRCQCPRCRKRFDDLSGTTLSVVAAMPEPTPRAPRVAGIVEVGRSKKGLTSIAIGFDEVMDRQSIGNMGFYGVLGGEKRHKRTIYSRAVRLAGIQVDGNTGYGNDS